MISNINNNFVININFLVILICIIIIIITMSSNEIRMGDVKKSMIFETDENVVKQNTIVTILTFNKMYGSLEKYTSVDLNEMSMQQLREILINSYMNLMHYLILSPTIVKLTSLSFDEMTNKIIPKIQIAESVGIELNVKEVFIFIYKFLYIDLTSIDTRISNLFKEYENDIKNDSDNYRKYLNSKSKFVYIYIKRWINILNEIFKSSKQGDASVLKLKVNLHYYILDYAYFIKSFYELVQLLESDLNVSRLRDVLNKAIEEKTKDNILTYVKIRNNNRDDWNKRFNVQVDDRKRFMLVDYNDDNYPYYDNDGNVVENDITKKYLNINGNLQVDKYDHTYALGPFTRVFEQRLSNSDIASKMPDLVNALENSKPVFMIGYGASGAGKTSSLIYFNKKKEDGILIHLCNMMGRKGYSKAEIKTYEFFREGKDLQKIKTPSEIDSLNFVYSDGFKLKNKYVHTNNHPDRVKLLHEVNPSINLDDNNTTSFGSGSSLGEVIIHFIDNDRLVKATTNNSNSSRSHALIFVKLIGSGGKIANLIIGDFAGVENAFDCDNDEIIEQFLNIKSDINKEVPFYSNNKETIKSGFKEDADCADAIKSQDPLFSLKDRRILIKGLNEKYNNLQINIIHQLLSENQSGFDTKVFEKSEKGKTIDSLIEYIGTKDKIKAMRSFISVILGEKEVKNLDAIPKEQSGLKLTHYIQKEGLKFTSSKKIYEFFERNIKYMMVDPSKYKIANDYKTILDSMFKILDTFTKSDIDTIKTILNEIPNIIKEKKCKIDYGKKVCNIRKNEGVMINETLSDLRDVIKSILIEKNKSSIDLSPEFIDSCLPSYCTDDTCFSFKNSLGSKISSIIFDKIKDELKSSKCSELGCLNMIISVFCVLNLEKVANNPPHVPYVETNSIRYELNHYNKDTLKRDSAFIKKCKEMIKKVESYKSKVSDLLNNKDFKSLKVMLDKNAYVSMNVNDVIQKILNVLNEIDKSNAVSAIGTLQFVDTLSKYNTSEALCTNDVETNYNPIQKFKSSYKFKNIVTDSVSV